MGAPELRTSLFLNAGQLVKDSRGNGRALVLETLGQESGVRLKILLNNSNHSKDRFSAL